MMNIKNTVTETQNPLGFKKESRLLVEFAIPCVISMLVTALYNIVDQIFIGQGIGMLGNAATNIAFPLSTTCTAISLLLGIGSATNVSLKLGAGREKESASYAGCGILLMTISGIALFAITTLFLTPMLTFFGATKEVLPYAKQYTRITAIGFPFLIMNTGMSKLILADGSPRYSMISMLVGAIVNTILDPIFIFSLQMGMTGAALATIISQACSCVWVLSFLFGTRSTLRIKKQNLPLKAPVILPCLALGLSLFIMQASESIISVCFNSSLLKYGGDVAVGAMTILTSVMQFAMLPLQGLGQGAQPIMSYNYGAKNTERVKGTFLLLLKASLTYSIILWGLVMLFPQVFAGIFTSNPALVIFTKKALRVYMAVMFMFGIQISCQMAFNSLGKAISSIIVAVMRKFVLLIPLIYIMPHIFTTDQTMAVYMAEPVADFIAVTFTAILFSVQFKKALAAIRLN